MDTQRVAAAWNVLRQLNQEAVAQWFIIEKQNDPHLHHLLKGFYQESDILQAEYMGQKGHV